MNLTLIKNKLAFIIIIFAVIILIILGITIFSSQDNENDQDGNNQQLTRPNKTTELDPSIAPNVIVPPSEEDLPTSVSDIKSSIIANPIRNENGDLMLFETNEFTIEYIPAPDVFFVKINSDPATEYKQQSQDWFKESGLTQTDLCNLPVRFVLTNFQIRQSNPEFSSLPDGCTELAPTTP